MVELPCPAAIWRAIDSAWLTGIAKPMLSVWLKLLLVAAVFMPMTWPEALTSGPPESPEPIRASVCRTACSVSLAPLAEKVPDGHNRVAERHLGGVADRSGLQARRALKLQQRDIFCLVGAKRPRGECLAPAIDLRGHVRRAVDDVVVGQHQAGRADHNAGALSCRVLVLQLRRDVGHRRRHRVGYGLDVDLVGPGVLQRRSLSAWRRHRPVGRARRLR